MKPGDDKNQEQQQMGAHKTRRQGNQKQEKEEEKEEEEKEEEEEENLVERRSQEAKEVRAASRQVILLPTYIHIIYTLIYRLHTSLGLFAHGHLREFTRSARRGPSKMPRT